MIEVLEESADRLIVKLDPGGPIELSDLTESFAALARLYERHYRPEGEPAPKLYVTRMESGSIVAEIAPYALMLGAIIYTMDSSVIVADFVRRLWAGIKTFSDPLGRSETVQPSDLPSLEDAADIREFIKPLAGKKGATLGLKQARLLKRDGEKEILVEYKFDEVEINRAVINIDEALSRREELIGVLSDDDTSIKKEVMLFFDQASRRPGKEAGRTGDRGIVPDVSDKALPVYFRRSFQNLKDQMVKGEVNPLTNAFIVDVHVQNVDGEPKGYIVTDVHQVVPIEAE